MTLPDFDEPQEQRQKVPVSLDNALRNEIYQQRENYAVKGSLAGLVGGILLGGGTGGIRSGVEGAVVIGIMGAVTGYYIGKALGYNRGDRKINQEAKIKYSEGTALLIAEYLKELDKLR